MHIPHRRYNISVMNETQIRLFVAVAETGSFTKAGQMMNMTQPAVSRAISSLESELGVTLLNRHPRNGVVLTDIGKRIVVTGREILLQYEKISQEVAAEKGLETGSIRVGAFPAAASFYYPKIVRAINDKYPNINIQMYEGTVEEVRHWLDELVVDVGFLIPPLNDLDTRLLRNEALHVVFRDDHPFRNYKEIRIQDLSDEPMLVCKGGYELPVMELFRAGGANLNVKHITTNYPTALNMINEGLGICIMSELSLQSVPEHVMSRELTPKAYRKLHLAVPSFKQASIAVRLFVDTAFRLFPPAAAHPDEQT